jgi:hypothetical protein
MNAHAYLPDVNVLIAGTDPRRCETFLEYASSPTISQLRIRPCFRHAGLRDRNRGGPRRGSCFHGDSGVEGVAPLENVSRYGASVTTGRLAV